MFRPPPARQRLRSALPFGALLLAIATPAAAEPTIAPLEGEPIIRTLEAGERPAAKPVAISTAAKVAAEAPAAVAVAPQTELVSNESGPREIGNRVLVLYGVVVVSLLGVMVLAIFLINRRSTRRRGNVVSPPAPTYPLAAAGERLSFGDPIFTNSSAQKPPPRPTSPS